MPWDFFLFCLPLVSRAFSCCGFRVGQGVVLTSIPCAFAQGLVVVVVVVGFWRGLRLGWAAAMVGWALCQAFKLGHDAKLTWAPAAKQRGRP